FREEKYAASTQPWSWKRDYVYRGDLLLSSYALSESGTTQRLDYHLDHIGTPRLITDDAGQQVSVHHYYPFGREITEPAGETMKFTGHERDSTPYDYQDYMHARYDNPFLGRFLSVDPVLDAKKAASHAQTWNRYVYVANNPIRNTDPTGRQIYEQTHFVMWPFYHTSIRIVPEDQKRWANDPRFKNVDPNTGLHYATIGAGSVNGKLVAGVNRERDVNLSIKREAIKLNLNGKDENTVINNLFKLQAAYKNHLEYSAFPTESGQYNSNSFARGLAEAAGLYMLQPHEIVPGFSKPVPEVHFGITNPAPPSRDW
ncbi:MAG TPA: RHS repeat-associated core domain-containing protein, partial [Thermoanaerobaculia bacterium]|nr:RHS repeat-associated core domain-containing protein [Thermoanaerobaculia bacterium]